MPRRRILQWSALLVLVAAGAFTFALERSTHASFGGIDIKGSVAFRARTIEALRLMQSDAPREFDEVCAVVTQIRQDARSGTDVETGRVTIANASSLDVSLAWFASVLAHEAHHARLFRIERKHRQGNEVFTAEIDCINVQLEVLKRLGGNEREIDWLASKRDGHHPDMDHDGKYTWDDYYKRDW